MSIMTLFGRHYSIRDRLAVALELAGVVGIAWLYLFHGDDADARPGMI
jgi:hypothetical protein